MPTVGDRSAKELVAAWEKADLGDGGVGQDPALDLRRPGRPGPGVGRPADRPGSAAGCCLRSASTKVAAMRIDLHTHSDVSDGTDTPAELVRQAQRGRPGRGRADRPRHLRRAGRGGRPRASGWASRSSAGMELSCSREGHSVHLLAYGADPASPVLAAEMGRVRGGRLGRLSRGAGEAGRAGRAGDRGRGDGRGREPARRWVGRTSPTPWSRPGTSATGPRPSTGSWPTAARPTCRDTRSTSTAASTWSTTPAAWR